MFITYAINYFAIRFFTFKELDDLYEEIFCPRALADTSNSAYETVFASG